MTFFSAFILGLLASAHCAGMCGGFQLALQTNTIVRSKRQMIEHLLMLNVGRLTTYITAGILLGLLGLAIVNSFDLPRISESMRLFSGVIILLIGIQLLLKKMRPFQFLETLGASLWQWLSPKMSHTSNLKRQSFFTGIIWGFLPCGLVYGVLIISVFANSIPATALVMLGFGLGTLPALLLTGGMYQYFRDVFQNQWIQLSGGLFFILGGLLMLSSPFWVNKDFLSHYPALLNLAFCVS